MSNFFVELRNYYTLVAEVLRGQASVARIFPNMSDVGSSRERIYAEFLKQHAPSKCNVFFGGFLFDQDGTTSKQLDIIATTDTAPRFNFHNSDGSGKSFSPVEGTLGVFSIKSTLDRDQLFDALKGIASIPPTRPLSGRVNPLLNVGDYDDWPLKVIYASAGLKAETILSHVNAYYGANPHIPLTRRPHFIHVSGTCLIARATGHMELVDQKTRAVTPIEKGVFMMVTDNSDVQAIVWTISKLQENASASSHINFSYTELINKLL